MTRALVLWDFENSQDASELRSFLAACTEVHVVIAVSEVVAEHQNPLPAVAGLVAGLTAGCRGQPVVSTELALVLRAPEAADRALMALAKASPSARGAGEFGRTVVVSKDHDLRNAILGGSVRGIVTKTGKMSKGNTRLRQRPQHAGPLAPGVTAAAGPTAVVDRTSAATRTRQTPLRLPSLSASAAAVQRTPALVTELGITWRNSRSSSLAGVGRLMSCLHGRDLTPSIPIGREVYELQVADPRPMGAPTAWEASLAGLGAVAVLWRSGRETVRTSFPPSFVHLAVTGGTLVLRTNSSAVDELTTLAATAGSPAPRHVELGVRPILRPITEGHLYCFAPAHGEDVAYVSGHMLGKHTFKLFSTIHHPTAIDVTLGRRGDHMIWVSSVPSGELVTLEDDVHPQQVGRARNGQLRCLVAALRNQYSAGDTVRAISAHLIKEEVGHLHHDNCAPIPPPLMVIG